MTGNFDDKGASGTVGVVASALLLPVAGFFVKGKNAKMPIGLPVNGFIDEDIPFEAAAVAATPAPLQAMPVGTPLQVAPAVTAPTPVAAPKLTPVSVPAK